jgi:hypothetical protein
MSSRPMLSGEGSRIALGPVRALRASVRFRRWSGGSRGERSETPLNLFRGVMHPPLGWLSVDGARIAAIHSVGLASQQKHPSEHQNRMEEEK